MHYKIVQDKSQCGINLEIHMAIGQLVFYYNFHFYSLMQDMRELMMTSCVCSVPE